MAFLLCWQKHEEAGRDAEDEATTTVGTFELVDGTQVFLFYQLILLGVKKYILLVSF